MGTLHKWKPLIGAGICRYPRGVNFAQLLFPDFSLILIGHLRDSPSPVPLTVDGDTIPSQGWTVVRWVYDL